MNACACSHEAHNGQCQNQAEAPTTNLCGFCLFGRCENQASRAYVDGVLDLLERVAVTEYDAGNRDAAETLRTAAGIVQWNAYFRTDKTVWLPEPEKKVWDSPGNVLTSECEGDTVRT